MTKRFEKAKFGTVIQDNSKQDTLWTATECIDRMNELAEEYEQLKSSDTITDLETEIMNLKTTIQQLRTDNTKQKKLLNTTMKENEQLKQRINNRLHYYRELYNHFDKNDGFSHDIVERVVEDLEDILR